MEKQRLLITGASGFLGASLAYAFRDQFSVLGTFHSHSFDPGWMQMKQVDLTDPDRSFDVVKKFSPHICIHCAALANVDTCEEDYDVAYQANVQATKNVAQAVGECGGKLVFISTDSVYKGSDGCFTEEAPVGPRNCYAKTKLLGEREALNLAGTLVVRTAFYGWNIGPGKPTVAEWMYRELSQGRPIRGFVDVITSALNAMDLSELLRSAIDKDLAGVFNFGSSDSISKYDLAVMIAEAFGFDKELIAPVSFEETFLKASRSKNLSLSSLKLERELGCALPSIRDGIDRFCREREELCGACQDEKGLRGS